jgi:hypothetical protein
MTSESRLIGIQKHIRGFGGDVSSNTVGLSSSSAGSSVDSRPEQRRLFVFSPSPIGSSLQSYRRHPCSDRRRHPPFFPSLPLFTRNCAKRPTRSAAYMVIVPQVDWIWRIVAKGHGGSSSERLARLRERSPEELLYLAHKVARVREMLKGSLTGRSGPGASSPMGSSSRQNSSTTNGTSRLYSLGPKLS